MFLFFSWENYFRSIFLWLLMLRKDVASRVVAVAPYSLFIRRSWQSEAFCIVSELIKTQQQQQDQKQKQKQQQSCIF